MKRSSGVLMHITSLPGRFGIGTFGQSAYDFVDFLTETKQTYWQILPLTTTSYGDSPYQSFSAIAGNMNLIDFDKLVEEGLLTYKDFDGVNFGNNEEKVDYALLFEARRPILDKAVLNVFKDKKHVVKFESFKKENSSWLTDYAEYMAIKEHFGYQSFVNWDKDIKSADLKARAKYREKLIDKIRYYEVTQYFFFKQWLELKKYANDNGIKIIGDMPIYVSADSVEMWLMPELFKIDNDNKPLFVAGCPADDFSPEGQLWGNPIYNWKKHEEENFAWWIHRVKESFKIYDMLRIDHFKGFSDYWQIDSDAETAKVGTWEPGPGIKLFDEIKKQLGELPIIAENLGFIDERAEKLLEDSGYPGMKILQFGMDEGNNSLDLPHNYTANSIAYTGTHDNDVINGWYAETKESAREFLKAYTNMQPWEKVSEVMIRTIYSSPSNLAIVTMQDLLDKGASSRMNVPSTVGGNWDWRMKASDLTQERKDYLRKVTTLYARTRVDKKKELKTDKKSIKK